MKLLLTVMFALAVEGSHASSAPIVDDGDRVLVKGAIEGCPLFPGVLTLQRVEVGQELDFFGISVPVLGRTAAEIGAEITHRLSDLRRRPDRVHLMVIILKTEQDYLLIRDQVVKSYAQLAPCVHAKDKSQPSLEELMKQLDWEKTA